MKIIDDYCNPLKFVAVFYASKVSYYSSLKSIWMKLCWILLEYLRNNVKNAGTSNKAMQDDSFKVTMTSEILTPFWMHESHLQKMA